MKTEDFARGYAYAVDRMQASKRVNLGLPSLFLDGWKKAAERDGAVDVFVGKLPNKGGVVTSPSAAQAISVVNQALAAFPGHVVEIDHAVALIDLDEVVFYLAHGAVPKDPSLFGNLPPLPPVTFPPVHGMRARLEEILAEPSLTVDRRASAMAALSHHVVLHSGKLTPDQELQVSSLYGSLLSKLEIAVTAESTQRGAPKHLLPA
jgi:hypothetical protein